ncbi:lipocalin family protein [Flagellimonas eckloniae]|uniref:Lipocalin-like domain-containing protein n=1 Tax=Flagellimonas eckloniae TaxID=346185 RepID=A0A0Q1BVP7_9FLAO|nr:lipocalin family protein [Allomuricauda eckloniae]KQC28576.1 hypothetical protein AAY42_00650 [Allomuricauda eckloniae]
MKKILLFYVILFSLGCKNTSISKEDLSHLNGYWEISEVEFPDGTKKKYSVNPSVDFIQIEDMKGFRKKVQPKFDGNYTTSNDTESFNVSYVNEMVTLHYKNNLSAWEEKLVQLDSSYFSVLNEEGIKYSYKRFQPIVIPK